MSYPANPIAAEPESLKTDRVLTVTFCVIADRASVRQSVFHNRRVGSNERVSSDSTELMHAAVGAERRVILDIDVTGERSAVCEDNVVADPAVVCDVSLSHEEIVRTDLRQVAAAFRPSMQRCEFAKRVALAGAQPTPFAAILLIVRDLPGGHEWEKDRAAAELRWTFDYTVAGYPDIVVQNDVVADA